MDKTAIRLLVASTEKRLIYLSNLAKSDPIYEPIADKAHHDNLVVTFHCIGPKAYYCPASSDDESPSLQLSQFLFPPLMAHLYLHELYHYSQDSEGRLVTPRTLADGPHNHLSVEALSEHYLLCEAEAAIEAIAASWRLFKANKPLAWNGALRSRDWKHLTREYRIMRSAGLDEAESKEKLTRLWYAGKHVQFYKAQAALLAASKNE